MLTALGGLALFLLGIERITSSLTSLSGRRMRRAMASATRGPLRALGTGTAVSALTQSGTATAVTCLGLVTSGLVAVREGIAMSLGAKVGATLAIQLAAFDVAEAAVPLVGVGFVLLLWRRARPVGGLLVGAGMLFLGLDITVGAMADLKEAELFRLAIDAAERQPFAVAAVGALLGALLSSTNGVTAVALGLYAAGGVEFQAALALVVGGNVGGTLLPLLAARDMDVPARRVAASHLAIKTLGAVAAVAAAGWIAGWIAALGGDGARQIANLHTGFNLVVALVGTVLAGPAARLATRALPSGGEGITPKYLRDDALDDPHLASALAERETVRIADQVLVMAELAVDGLQRGRWEAEAIGGREAKVDRLTHIVVDYLARLRSQHGSDPESERLLLIANELEHLGDQVRRLAKRDARMREDGIEFSRDGRDELARAGRRVVQRMRSAFTAMATTDERMAQKVAAGRGELERFDAELRVAHLSRLEDRLPESQASSSHHLEMLTTLRQIDFGVTRIARWIQGTDATVTES